MRILLRNLLISFGFVFLILFGLFYFSDIFEPLVFGGFLAYFLDPLADRLVKYRIPRPLAASVLILLSLVLISTFVIFMGPIFTDQLLILVQSIPVIYNLLMDFADGIWFSAFGEKLDSTDMFLSVQSEIGENFSLFMGNVIESSVALVGFFTKLTITVLIAFYLLLDWDRLTAFCSNLVPKTHRESFDALFQDIDDVLAKFFRGQIAVCVLLASYYGLSLVALGLNSGLILGCFAGLISFIPFFGAILGGGLSIILSVVQFWHDPLMITLVILVFIMGQVLEGNFLTPNLVGKSVGIHPVWVILALTFFGQVGGLTGLMLALPITAVIGVLLKRSLKRYFLTDFYNLKGK